MGLHTVTQSESDIIIGHLASMRYYADSLSDSALPLVSRAKVIARIRKCAAEVDRAHAMFKAQEKRREVAEATRGVGIQPASQIVESAGTQQAHYSKLEG
jgi:uncharacterized small protein (DUF1192 family)